MADKFVPVLRFVAMSDLHFHDEDDVHVDRFRKGMKELYEYCDSHPDYKGLDLVTINGDFANNGSEIQMIKLRDALAECLRDGTDTLITLASHEFYTEGGEEVALERYGRIFNKAPDNDIVVKGFHFIGLTTTKGCHFSDEKIAWLRARLEEDAAEDRRRPIFVFQHPHVTDTVYGSIDWGEKELYPTLADYPQIIDFSGHSHAPVNDPRSIYQKHFTAMGTGTLAYFELDEFDKYYGTVPPRKQGAQYLVVEVAADNRILVKPYDILTGNFFPLEWHIDVPSDPETFIYTGARYLTDVKPYFPDDTFIDILADENGEMNITFSQALCDEEYVNYYKVVILDSDGCIVRQRMLWSEYYFYDMPKTVNLMIEGLIRGEEYTCRIYAYGFWNNRCDKPAEKKFTA